MIKSHNPYAKALDGLDIPNPVRSFFNFCIEREKIRKKREQGLPQPWTDDEIRDLYDMNPGIDMQQLALVTMLSIAELKQILMENQ